MKRVGPPSDEVTCDKLKERVAEAKLAVAYFGDISAREYSEVFIQTADHPSVGDKFQFYHTTDKECAASYGASSTPAVLLFRKFDESPVVYSGEWESQALVNWMQTQSVPTLIEFSEEYIEPIFGNRRPALFLLRSAADAESSNSKVFAQAANELKGQIIFAVSGVTDGIQARLAEFIGVEESQLPTIRLLDPNDNMKKYTFPGNAGALTVESIKEFIGNFKDGNLKPFLKTQEAPADNSQPLKVVVGKTFNDQVIYNNNDVFIKFYAPWCGHCKKMAPDWEKLAEELKDVPGLVIADFDATANEAENVDIRGFPTLKFYPMDNKNGPLDYEGNRELDGFKEYLKEHSKAYKKYLESKTEL